MWLPARSTPVTTDAKGVVSSSGGGLVFCWSMSSIGISVIKPLPLSPSIRRSGEHGKNTCYRICYRTRQHGIARVGTKNVSGPRKARNSAMFWHWPAQGGTPEPLRTVLRTFSGSRNPKKFATFRHSSGPIGTAAIEIQDQCHARLGVDRCDPAGVRTAKW